MKNTHSREYAVDVIKTLFDELGIKEDRRIDPNFDAAEIAIISALKEQKATEKQIAEFTEKCDVDRESVISLIREKRLTLDDKNQMVYSLRYPIKTDDGTVNIETLTFKNRVRVREVEAAMKGCDTSSNISVLIHRLSSRVGHPAVYLEEMDEIDADTCSILFQLFSRAKKPMQ